MSVITSYLSFDGICWVCGLDSTCVLVSITLSCCLINGVPVSAINFGFPFTIVTATGGFLIILEEADESEMRRKIAEELQKGLEEERRKSREELNRWLEKEKSQAHVQAQAEAQAQVKDEVSRILALEKEKSVQKAILRERVTAEDEKLQVQIYQMERKARQLEERDKELRKQDAFYREQVAKLKERSAQFYKVTNENYHKAAEEVNAKFKRYDISPVCTDLQGQILKCYRENGGKTLLCSNIASQYMQCVNKAKQDKLRT
ncbi:MICOS complex subunit MIC19 isoform X5 [Carassius gibelio]|uniref:MICOS complex subunit MIC19 isoform X5 n=1 Tax=Carassius gibelio TaxID=101364 RepID=UPI002278EC2B|nr:MICOS complex subunit MIC19 isoform X5 [Carassius gibelio]